MNLQTTDTISARALAGERVPVHSNGGVAGYVTARGGQFHFEVTSGPFAGVSEPICFLDSSYLDRNYRAA